MCNAPWVPHSSRHIDPHKPSKGSQTIANSNKKTALCVPDWSQGASFRCISAISYFSKLFITLAPPLRDLRVPSRTGHTVHLEISCYEMTARKQCFLTIYVLHRHRGYCFGCFFQLFPIIRNIWPHLFSFTIVLYGKRSLPHLGYGYMAIHDTVYAIARCTSAEMSRRL